MEKDALDLFSEEHESFDINKYLDKSDNIQSEEDPFDFNHDILIPFSNDDYGLERNEMNNNQHTDALNFFSKTEIKSTSLTDKKNKSGKKIVFKIMIPGKRGKSVSFKPNKRIHHWDSFDLISNKLQVHYLSYLVNLANDITNIVLKNKDYKKYFLDIIHARKIKLFTKRELKTLKYKDIFMFIVSKKNPGIIIKGQTNEENYINICNKSSLLKEFFEQSYLDIFNDYYLNDIRIINFKGLNVILSEKTKTFENLINKDSNRMAKDRFQVIIDKNYINNNNEIDADY